MAADVHVRDMESREGVSRHVTAESHARLRERFVVPPMSSKPSRRRAPEHVST